MTRLATPLRCRTARPCPVCGSTEAEPLYENRLAQLYPPGPVDMSYHVADCRNCRMIYADQLPEEGDYEIYYREFSKYDLICSTASIPAMLTDRADGAVNFLRRNLPQATSIYDIGCSVGVFLSRCRLAGFHKVGGIDPAPEAPALAHALFGIDIESGFFRGDGCALAEYELVSLAAVLEHMRSPLETLVSIQTAMAAGSHLYIEVPAGDHFGELTGEALGELSLEHINYFGRTTLARMAARAGFLEVAAEYCTYLDKTVGLRGLYRLQPGIPTVRSEEPDVALAASLRRYLARGHAVHARQVQELADCDSQRLVVYGAGSHTARLLPLLRDRGIAVCALLDRNANLQGKSMGDVPILPPQALSDFPQVPVAVSTYHARREIAAFVAAGYGNRVINLYPSGDVSTSS